MRPWWSLRYSLAYRGRWRVTRIGGDSGREFVSLFSSWSPHRLYWPLRDSPFPAVCRTLAGQSAHSMGGLQPFLGRSGSTVLSAQAVWGLLQACLALGAGPVLQPRGSDQSRIPGLACTRKGSISFIKRKRKVFCGLCPVCLSQRVWHTGCLLSVYGKNEAIEHIREQGAEKASWYLGLGLTGGGGKA